MKKFFRQFAHGAATAVGSPWAFVLAVVTILVWALSGPLFGFSDTWQLLINTATTLVTFLMVFLIQTTQNRDAKAIHLKLDELIQSIDSARNRIVDVEDAPDEVMDGLQKEFQRVGKGGDRREVVARSVRHPAGSRARAARSRAER